MSRRFSLIKVTFFAPATHLYQYCLCSSPISFSQSRPAWCTFGFRESIQHFLAVALKLGERYFPFFERDIALSTVETDFSKSSM